MKSFWSKNHRIIESSTSICRLISLSYRHDNLVPGRLLGIVRLPKQPSQSSVALAWFKTGNHTIVGPMLPTALCPLCVGLLGAYCLTVILRACIQWRTKPKHGITGPYRSQVFFPFFLLFFPFLFFLLLSFFLSFFLFPFLPFLSSFFLVSNRPWAAQNQRAHVGDRQNATTASPPMLIVKV